jgi:hypothetical protein
VLHGGLSSAERRAALGRFRRGDATVLLTTDVAGQGLNLQHAARWVVSLELPWNPARLEQRLGRVDRLGQTRAVHLSLVIARHEAENGLLSHLARRTLAARRALGPDALGSAAPGEAQLGAALIAGDPVAGSHPPAPTPVAICRRWQRPARAHARALGRQRRLAGRWPANVAPPTCIWIRSPHPGWLGLGTRPGCVLVFDASITDASGLVLEKRPVAVRVPQVRERAHLSCDVLEAAEQAVRDQLAPRLDRLNRIRQQWAAGEAVTSAAVWEAAAADLPAIGAQPGLFDRRALAAREAELEERRRMHSELSGHVSRLERSLVVGRPALRVAILPAQ